MGALGVGFGAFGAHALKDRLTPNDLAIFDTGIRYFFYHALGVCVLSLMMTRIDNGLIKTGSILMVIGAFLFAGSLIALVLTGHRWLGMVTPIGGVMLILAWVLAAVSLLRV
jgi:uncharacterized membrane protein YgdD (TMEM256/DUF423 family)